jgi:hypothetical protein
MNRAEPLQAKGLRPKRVLASSQEFSYVLQIPCGQGYGLEQEKMEMKYIERRSGGDWYILDDDDEEARHRIRSLSIMREGHTEWLEQDERGNWRVVARPNSPMPGTLPRPVIRSDGRRFGSLTEAVRNTPGSHKSGIIHACRGKIAISAGFGWKYDDGEEG